MIGKRPKRPSAGAQMAEGLAQWEGEGGAGQTLSRAERDRADVLAEAERHILECLGAAVVMEWNDLPTHVQRALFRHASAAKESYDPVQLKARIARFLHDHKDDAGAL